MKKICKLLGLVFLYSNSAYTQNYVNVLTWWGYLDSPWIAKMVKDECHVNLSYDTYNSNDELIQRWNEQGSKYDALIFSDTVYNSIKEQIALQQSNLYRNSNNYNPTIRKKYLLSQFSPNIAYFMHSLTGFIWNPSVIQLNKKDTPSSIFKKAQSNMVALLDDPVEIHMLLALDKNRVYSKNDATLSWENFKKVTKKAKVFISNQPDRIYNRKQFAFAFEWSGDAITEIIRKPQYNYKFLVNNKLSYVSSDLIAQLKDSAPARCVAELFSSKIFLSKLQNEAYYFSPYGNTDRIPEGQFKSLYHEFLRELPSLAWLQPAPEKTINKLNQQWSIIKYELTK